MLIREESNFFGVRFSSRGMTPKYRELASGRGLPSLSLCCLKSIEPYGLKEDPEVF